MLYRYVGPPEILALASDQPKGTLITSPDTVRAWITNTSQTPEFADLYAATFVVDETNNLLISDRRSEHVACAGGGVVRAAGELFFRLADAQVSVVEASNQSTGYCPEPECWASLAQVLERVGISHPGRFTLELHFRLCSECRHRCVVKDNWFACITCGGDLVNAFQSQLETE